MGEVVEAVWFWAVVTGVGLLIGWLFVVAVSRFLDDDEE